MSDDTLEGKREAPARIKRVDEIGDGGEVPGRRLRRFGLIPIHDRYRQVPRVLDRAGLEQVLEELMVHNGRTSLNCIDACPLPRGGPAMIRGNQVISVETLRATIGAWTLPDEAGSRPHGGMAGIG